MRAPWPLLAAALFAAAAAPGLAVDGALTPQAVQRAVAEGRTMALQHAGFTIPPYLLFGSDDATRLHDAQTIEAIEIRTPYERLRYRGFLSGFERGALSNDAAQALYDQVRAQLDVVVYVHSRSETDRDFLNAFGDGALECGDGSHVPAQTLRDAPVRDVYLTGTTTAWRWRGEITYRFPIGDALSGCRSATLEFSDDAGAPHRYPIVLAGYR